MAAILTKQQSRVSWLAKPEKQNPIGVMINRGFIWLSIILFSFKSRGAHS
jgi:hypothetical protein